LTFLDGGESASTTAENRDSGFFHLPARIQESNTDIA
jgi:hypothetical protein